MVGGSVVRAQSGRNGPEAQKGEYGRDDEGDKDMSKGHKEVAERTEGTETKQHARS